MRKRLGWTVLVGLLLMPAWVSAIDEFDVDDLQQRIHATIEKVTPAVVTISGRGAMFSGVIVSPEGHVLSAGHAVRPGASYSVQLTDGRRLSAKGMGANTRLDCALVKINGGAELPYAEMGESGSLVPNQPCLSLSYPGGQGRGAPVVRFGYIKRSRTSSFVQSTALMEPGDSGGPLFDLHGKVIGIHSRIGRQMDRNYEVPIDTYKKYWEHLNQPANFVAGGPALPKIGLQIDETEDQSGVLVYRLTEEGPARKSGLKVDDLILQIQGKSVTSESRLRSALRAAFEQDLKEITVKLRRRGEDMVIKIPFEKPELGPPPYQRFTSDNVPPKPISELANLPQQFSALESELDDHCVVVESTTADRETRIVATCIAGSPLLVSKSSMVGTEPHVVAGDARLKLEVVARDSRNDLVLLRGAEDNKAGVALASAIAPPAPGRFLISPDPLSEGWVSVVSTGAFASRKTASKGYLGVVLSTHENRGVILNEVNRGAARSAGLQTGDVITRMNDVPIRSRSEMLRFLSGTEPNQKTTATVERGAENLKLEIVLGQAPSRSNHAADMMEKSQRRDGFSKVISHDADLEPHECGGPLFDLKGNLIGLNIARNSRVRSFAIPVHVVQSFVEQHAR